MKAVHCGAGNIGRGFVGFLLDEAGYELVFSDVNAELIAAINAADSYTVHEVGQQPRDLKITGFSGINSAQDPQALREAIAQADVLTTAVGPTILPLIAADIAAGLRLRAQGEPRPPLAVMACENAIAATDILAKAVREHYEQADEQAIFANTAVDRIVPDQAPGQGLDVTVETYYEWVIEAGPFAGKPLDIPGVTWVDDLEPYISRKLFTVNTGHAATAYFGYAQGKSKISDALADEGIAGQVAAALAETKNLVVHKFGFEPQVQQAYVDKIMRRFANPSLPDTAERVGRAPLRKLGRHERFVGPAAELAELGLEVDGLLAAVGALLKFDAADDAEAVQLQQRLDQLEAGAVTASQLVSELTGVAADHVLHERLVEVFSAARA
ncbi:MAG: mannitol-1-phosphate 5-dehydrogenase [Rothia sp. (in: high G+C Gram-positive bacteria)]|nr:mannitol-1-phosphate 5-dehydrogenase [Rothia sp. (in: high G+C Gram-positive bacteria)]